jgi:dolichol-phosphate mannosyltransferase
VVLKARQHADEVVVVDDGSTDDTAEVAEAGGAVVVRHETKRGYGAAIRSCFVYARSSTADAMVILDGDGQHNAAAIPKVLEPVLSGRADIAIGSRFLNGNGHEVPRYRRFGIGVLTRLTNAGTHNGNKLSDAQSGFRAYSREAIEVLDPRESDMGASAEIIWDADSHHLRMEEVAISVAYGKNGSTRGPVRHGLGVLGSMLVYIENKHALLTFGLPGLVVALVGFGLGVYVVDSYYATRVPAIGLAILTVGLIFVGTLLLFTGLILHAVINANRRMR